MINKNRISVENNTYTIYYNGWAGRIRTYEMPESKSGALPLGDSPIYYIDYWGG